MTNLESIKHKAAVLAALTVLYPILFTVGYVALVKISVSNNQV